MILNGVIVPVSNAISAFVSPWTICGPMVFLRAVHHRRVYSLQVLFNTDVVMCIPWVIMALATDLIIVRISAGWTLFLFIPARLICLIKLKVFSVCHGCAYHSLHHLSGMCALDIHMLHLCQSESLFQHDPLLLRLSYFLWSGVCNTDHWRVHFQK